jgi:hypothetical protein
LRRAMLVCDDAARPGPYDNDAVREINRLISPGKLDRRKLSKYSRALRFAARLNCHASDLKRVVKDRRGGLNACAARF